MTWASAFFAIVAAGVWFWASLLPAPKELTVITYGDTGFGGELPKLFSAFAKQSRLNAAAAACAAISALLQAGALIQTAMPTTH